MKLRLFWRRIHEFRSLSMCASAAKPLTKLSGHHVCIISKGNQSEYVRSVKATESSIPLNSHPFRCSSASQSEEEKLLQAAVVKQELSSRILDAFRNHELGGEEMWEKTWWKYDVPYPYVPQISPYICLLKDDCAMHVHDKCSPLAPGWGCSNEIKVSGAKAAIPFNASWIQNVCRTLQMRLRSIVFWELGWSRHVEDMQHRCANDCGCYVLHIQLYSDIIHICIHSI